MAQSDCCLISTFETSLDGFVALWTAVSVAQKAPSLVLTTLGHEPVAWAQKINCICFISKHILLHHSMTVTKEACI